MSRLPRHLLPAAALVASGAILAACSLAGGGTPSGSPTTNHPPPPPVPAQFAGHTSVVYSQDANWLCRPGALVDHCTQDNVDATVVNADGTTRLETRQIAKDAPVDCFYVYPTVNNAPGGGNHLNMADTALEQVVVDLQAARFSSVCKVYAPVYRQMNLSAYVSPDKAAAEAVAYADVKDAFAYYMAHWNKGRPIVLLGHSQGSFHLTKLLSEEFDANPDMRSRLVSALLAGGAVKVPPGQDVGGTFKNIPLCHSSGQTGCVVTYNSYGTNPPPDPTAIFGIDAYGLVGACVNPAAPGGGSGMLKPYLGKDMAPPVSNTVATKQVVLPNAISAQCETGTVSGHVITYLGITAATRPGDVRDVRAAVTNRAGWGLHYSDVDLAMGNLIDLVRAERATLGL